ncbi:LL-diaminopimelate aminotransferase [Anaerotignum sp. MSJ-24]|uniref:LL-diaminopimelate aminotransferase n=1 Tax=Anaerotignum sp. MSJ-24 TaxID=2841521 RepID=UPI001C11A023|nr:LL-diaminopimelate aminotransferase [Anaerotignum sp. MSJ-24]MBU5463355.1 LL-diaminopimelate aminotransferase [Anaerotignum sp. MSJ-24]
MNIKLNDNFDNVKESYLFSEIAKRVNKYSAEHPEAKIIRLGIGDCTLPLTKTVIDAMHKAVDEMGVKETFRGYPPEYGYDFLREAISKYYASNGVDVAADEIFVSDGAKSDCGNIVDILGDNTILIPDPVYPVYMDSNIMSGRKIELISGNQENGFLPMPNGLEVKPYVIYICSPNNPTGATYNKEQLGEWIAFAKKSGSLIIFDSAYEAFIKGDYPHSIYAVEGARECVIEICSFSKMAGFTGTRCSWTVFPKELEVNGKSVQKMWARRQATKFNGVPYVIQRAAEAALSPEGVKEAMANIDYYMSNGKLIGELLKEKGVWFSGGVCSPYIWLKCPNNMKSWDFFDMLLEKVQVVGTPGAGFGDEGEGYFRLTSFGSREATIEAIERLKTIL